MLFLLRRLKVAGEKNLLVRKISVKYGYMYSSLKELTIKYLQSLPCDIFINTAKRRWTRDDLLNEVESDTKLGKDIININKKYLTS